MARKYGTMSTQQQRSGYGLGTLTFHETCCEPGKLVLLLGCMELEDARTLGFYRAHPRNCGERSIHLLALVRREGDLQCPIDSRSRLPDDASTDVPLDACVRVQLVPGLHVRDSLAAVAMQVLPSWNSLVWPSRVTVSRDCLPSAVWRGLERGRAFGWS